MKAIHGGRAEQVATGNKTLAELRRDGEWAGSALLLVFCHVFQAPVTVYQVDASTQRLTSLATMFKEEAAGTPERKPGILALVFANHHWTPLVPAEARTYTLNWNHFVYSKGVK